ncbi:GDP-L-fucose synthase family protein [Salinibacterium hongtaonis]|uniref:GDP-L-fucose synthase n=1 Tax=Homoserinimonas hongtaonis TaxID=2079791 RepID=A0A2U1SWU4_9MICO|nr:GDP-L-fucose synthase [Salinibacterium hongtaonis]PWB96062.1 GDP-fucose synthetase [Salinibacterium hongtaonis]
MKIAVTGARGMLGSSIVQKWAELRPEDEVVGISRQDVDLRDARATEALISELQPDALIHCAAQVGGIAANVANPSGFLSNNLQLDQSVIGGARSAGVDQFIYIGSSCMYPRDYRQPLVETDILAAPLEPTNEGYAIAKIAGAKQCEYLSREFGVSYKTIIPSNLYGPNDDYDTGHSHLVAAAISKLHAAKVAAADSVEIWGDGSARREFTYVDDLGDWLVRNFEEQWSWPSLMNVGCGYDHSVLELYEFARDVVGFDGGFTFDTSKPAGMFQKLMDSSIARGHGWDPQTTIETGMAISYERYLAEH